MSPPTAVGPVRAVVHRGDAEPAVKERVARLLARIDGFQQRHRVLGLPIAVFKRFGEHDGGRLSATISYYAFFSLFPLLLVFVTILGLVLQDNPEPPATDLVDGALGQIPVIGSQLKTDSLPGQGWVLALGIVTALWAGLGAVTAVQHALDTIADVPMHDRGNALVRKGKAIAYLALLAIGLSLSTYLSNLASVVGGGILTGALGLLATFAVERAAARSPWSPCCPPTACRCATTSRASSSAPSASLAAAAARQLRRAPLHRRRQRHLRHVRHRHRPAQLVLPRQPAAAAVGRAQLRAGRPSSGHAGWSPPTSPTDADRRATMLDVQPDPARRPARLRAVPSTDGWRPGRRTARRGRRSAGDVEVTGQPADLEQPLDGRAR